LVSFSLLTTHRDVEAIRESQRSAEEGRRRFQALSDASFEGVAVLDGRGAVVDANPAFLALFGHTIESIRGVSADSILFRERTTDDDRTSLDYTGLRSDGRRFPAETRRLETEGGMSFVVVRDATDRKRIEATLRGKADAAYAESLRDPLTGLHNRKGFLELGSAALASTIDDSCVFFVDLNGMKRINDELGHDAGDDALVTAAGVLRAAFRDRDILGRLGGDEFVALALHVGPDRIESIGRRIDKLVVEVNASKRHPFTLSVSIGSAFRGARSTDTLEALLAVADQRMYEEKRRRKAGRDDASA
jgi:diguanylate cyclase (GGDEF)-like protein/PAS domain S-box-containing protein